MQWQLTETVMNLTEYYFSPWQSKVLVTNVIPVFAFVSIFAPDIIFQVNSRAPHNVLLACRSKWAHTLKKKAHRKLTKEGNVKCPLNEPHHYSPLLLSPLPVLHKSTVFLLDSPCHNFFLCRSPTSVFPSLLRSLCRVVFTGLLRDGTTFWQGKKRKTQLTSIKENWKPRQSLIVR